MSKIFYIASLFGIVLMYCLYASKLACSLNIFFISWTAVLLIVMLVISLHPMVCCWDSSSTSDEYVICHNLLKWGVSHLQDATFSIQDCLALYIYIYESLLLYLRDNFMQKYLYM